MRPPSATMPSGVIVASFADDKAAKAPSDRRMTGMRRPNISEATIAPSVSVSSGPEKTKAAGFRPERASSSSTPEPEQEPRLVGISTIAPASEAPCKG